MKCQACESQEHGDCASLDVPIIRRECTCACTRPRRPVAPYWSDRGLAEDGVSAVTYDQLDQRDQPDQVDPFVVDAAGPDWKALAGLDDEPTPGGDTP